MAAALPPATRRRILQGYLAGQAYSALANAFRVNVRTVRSLCQRFEAEGEAGLVPRYAQCGPKQIRSDRLLYRAACFLKRRHPKWGAAFIQLQLEERYPDMPLPAVRTMQRWFKARGLTPRLSKKPQAEKRWATQVHQVWQVDAKERQHTADHTPVCWLSITDEHSTALLAAPVFPPCVHEPGAPGGRAGRPGPRIP